MYLALPIAFTAVIVYPLLGISPVCLSGLLAGVLPRILRAVNWYVKLTATFTPVSEDGE